MRWRCICRVTATGGHDMTTISVFKNNQGRWQGVSEEDDRALKKRSRYLADADIGTTAELGEMIIPRSPKHHRLFLRKVRVLLSRTEAMTDFDGLRKWLVVGAGYTEPDGTGGLRARSLKFAEMDEADFAELHRKVDDFLWTDHALEFLWPHLKEKARQDSMGGFFYEVERGREQRL